MRPTRDHRRQPAFDETIGTLDIVAASKRRSRSLRCGDRAVAVANRGWIDHSDTLPFAASIENPAQRVSRTRVACYPDKPLEAREVATLLASEEVTWRWGCGRPAGIRGDLVGRDRLEVVAVDPELAQLPDRNRELPPSFR